MENARCRALLLAFLAREPKAIPPTRSNASFSRTGTSLTWALAKRDPLVHRHGEVVDLLERTGAVTKKERKNLRPKLEIEIRDQREHDKRPLPPLPPWRS